MDDSENFNEKLLPKKEDFYSHLNMKDITDSDYAHAKRVCKVCEIESLGEYPENLADVFESFRNMCLEIYELDLACSRTLPRKKAKVKLDYLIEGNKTVTTERELAKTFNEHYITIIEKSSKIKPKHIFQCDKNQMFIKQLDELSNHTRTILVYCN